MNIPKLHIHYAYPFDQNRRRLFNEKDLGPYPSVKEVKRRAEEYEEIWKSVNENDRVIRKLIETTGVTLPRDLELSVFGRGMNAMSHPLIMPIMGRDGAVKSDEDFIGTTIHEITHRFVANHENDEGIADYWRSIKGDGGEYEHETPLTQNHILVYAVLEMVLGELFGKENVKKYDDPQHPEYIRAVGIVEEKGAQNLIEQFRSFLENMVRLQP